MLWLQGHGVFFSGYYLNIRTPQNLFKCLTCTTDAEQVEHQPSKGKSVIRNLILSAFRTWYLRHWKEITTAINRYKVPASLYGCSLVPKHHRLRCSMWVRELHDPRLFKVGLNCGTIGQRDVDVGLENCKVTVCIDILTTIWDIGGAIDKLVPIVAGRRSNPSQ